MASVRTNKPTQSRLRNPLNVVVDRISATRAMVQGDVSVESLRELLMSSLSLLPEAKATRNDVSVAAATESAASSTPKDAEVGDTDVKSVEPEEKKKDATATDQSLENKHSGRDSGRKGAEDRSSDQEQKGKRVEDKKRKSKKSRIDQTPSKSRSVKKKRGRGGSESYSSSSFGNLEEEDEEEESLPSCPTISGPEDSLLSHDAQWLRVYFGTALTQGLKKVVAIKPEDPVSWLAFFLRRYRSLEEERARRTRFEVDLRACRSLVASRINADETNKIESHFELDEENFGDGGKGDTNFQNYHPVSTEVDKDEEEET